MKQKRNHSHYHRYVSLIKNRVIFFSNAGKAAFEDTPESGNFKYTGTVTKEEKEAEEAKILAAADQNQEDFEKIPGSKVSSHRQSSKAATRELNEEQFKKATKGKTTEVKDEEEEEEEEEEKDKGGDDDAEAKREADKKALGKNPKVKAKNDDI